MLKIFALWLFVAPVVSWTIDVHPDLAYPPRWTAAPGDRYMSKNGTFLSPNYLDSCLNTRPPQNVSRSKFHVSNGRAIFDLVNATVGNPTNESFSIHIYLPHLWYRYEDGPGGTKYNTGSKGKYMSKRNFQRYDHWQNFPEKGKCYLPMNMTEMIVDENENALRPADLVGLNATLMFAVEDLRNYRVFEEVDQCAYVTLTDEDVQPAEDMNPCENYDRRFKPPEDSNKNSGVRPANIPSFLLIGMTILMLNYQL